MLMRISNRFPDRNQYWIKLPPRLARRTARPKTHREKGSDGASTPALSWIQIFAQSITDKVESEHRERDCQAGKDQRMRRSLQS